MHKHAPVMALQTFALKSLDAVSTKLVPDENTALSTQSMCPQHDVTHAPVVVFQTLTAHRKELGQVSGRTEASVSAESLRHVYNLPTRTASDRVMMHSPVVALQMFPVGQSNDVVITVVASVEKIANLTSGNVNKHSPDVVLQILAVRSTEVVSTDNPSGDQAANSKPCLCPENVSKQLPVVQHQSLAVLSYDAVINLGAGTFMT